MPPQNRYYEEELEYLDKAGAEFTRRHPVRAQHIGLRDTRNPDPHIERLIESFAFLTGHVRQRIDDDFPELTHSLTDLVWPHYLRPIPPLSLLRFEPVPSSLDKPLLIPRGFKVKSKQRTSLEVRCQFRTVYPVTLRPLALEEAQVFVDEDRGSERMLRLRFRLTKGANPENVVLDHLRLYLTGEPSVTYRAYRILTGTVKAIQLNFGRDRKPRFAGDQARRRIRRVGFAEDEGLLPYTDVSFPGYRLLAEYFAFPEKFLFVDLVDLGPLELERHEETFDLVFEFSERLPDNFRPTKDNFELHVTPIINLIERDGEPIKFRHHKLGERVRASFVHPDAYEILSVDEVFAMRQGESEPRRRHAFFSFEHDKTPDEGDTDDDGVFYHVTHEHSRDGRWVTRLSLISPRKGKLPEDESLSLAVTCMNGRLCRELGTGDITYPDGEALDGAVFRNITRPTRPIYPDLGDGAEWNFISHMALNFMSLADAASLRRILQLYDIEGRLENRRRIDGIRQAFAKPVERLIAGAPVRGTDLIVTVDESHFAEEGDLLLFSAVLGEFLALYANTNSFIRLIIRHTQREEDIECDPIHGRQSLI
jgi:type VI secretion system protein ImpG